MVPAMGTKLQEPLSPIVLLVGFPISTTEVRRELGFDTAHAEEFFGVSVNYGRIAVNPENKPIWWVDPTKDESMFEALKFKPSFSINKYKRWIESPQFVNYVRRYINHMIHYSLTGYGRPGFDPRWHEAVKMVVLSGWVSSSSEYVQRIFDDYFTNAKYWWWNSQDRKLQPIWRDALVTELKKQPSPSEVLGWPVSQLPSRLSGGELWLVQSVVPEGKVINLVQLTREQLQSAGELTDDVLDEVEEALGKHALKLGMSSLEIQAWHFAHNPPEATTAELVGCAG
jgi:hypothetical protein